MAGVDLPLFLLLTSFRASKDSLQYPLDSQVSLNLFTVILFTGLSP